MNCVTMTLLKICLVLIISLLTQVQTALPRKTGLSRANSTSLNGSFNPCKTGPRVLPSSKKYIAKISLSLVSTCGVRLVPLIGEEWGSLEKLLSFLPLYKHMACVVLRTLYAVFSNSNGRLPQRIALNGSEIYNVGYKMVSALLNDYSWSADVCSRTKILKGRKLHCYPKDLLLHAANLAMPCLREVFKDTVPEYAETAIHCMMLVLKKAQSTELFNNLFL